MGTDTQNASQALKFRVILPIIRAAGLVPWTFVFVLLFVLSSLVLSFSEPGIGDFLDAAWFLFQVVTTIGLGDYTCTTVAGRLATIVMSVYAVFFLALITGVLVSYCSERMKIRTNESVAAFLDRLERLPELSHEELVELSEQVKEIEKHIG